mmetsp:Transcript_17714/g.24724  ORF Transcript_17714/g.24724 Transcript_17714/m.24724 type:complete len:190 (+) Transcript_17714:2-571(+)
MLVLGVVLGATVEGVLLGLLLFYIADVVMLLLQIDFLRGLRWLSFIYNIPVSLLLATTARSSKNDASHGTRKTVKTNNTDSTPLDQQNTRALERKLTQGRKETEIAEISGMHDTFIDKRNANSNLKGSYFEGKNVLDGGSVALKDEDEASASMTAGSSVMVRIHHSVTSPKSRMASPHSSTWEQIKFVN